jgi:mRNA interferase HigB
MRAIAKKPLKEFWKKHKDAEQPLLSWYKIAKNAKWRDFNEVKVIFKNASIVGNDRIVFNIKGNDYRLIVRADFHWQLLFIRFVGTHKEYDKIDAKNI